MKDRNYVLVHKSVYGTTVAVNYSGRSDVNTFLHRFDIWGSWGRQVLCSDEQNSKFEFECSKEFLEFCKTIDFRKAFLSMGVEIVFDAEKVIDID